MFLVGWVSGVKNNSHHWDLLSHRITGVHIQRKSSVFMSICQVLRNLKQAHRLIPPCLNTAQG